MTGGRDFDESNYNRAMQMRRQAGSAFKPFVYAAALEAGYTPATLVTDLDDPDDGGRGRLAAGRWSTRRQLVDDGADGAADVEQSRGGAGAARSRDSDAVSTRSGVGSEAPAVPSLVLGSGEVTVLSMASAYGVFANGGMLRAQLHPSRGGCRRPCAVRSTREAIRAHQRRHGVPHGADARRRRQSRHRLSRARGRIQFPAGGKTGTTNEYRDAWFVGFTPALVRVSGSDSISQHDHGGGYAGDWRRRSGADSCATPLARGLETGSRSLAASPPPRSVACQAPSATEACHRDILIDQFGEVIERSQVATEYFRRGTEPQSECPIHNYTYRSGDEYRIGSYRGTLRFGRE